MEEMLSHSLGEAFTGVMETMAFMFAEPLDKDQMDTNHQAFLHAHMGFAGLLNGTVHMVAPRKMCVALAANILGIDPQEEECLQKAGDALKETLNTVCGRMLSMAGNEKAVYNLTTPLVEDADIAFWNTMKSDGSTLCFAIDEYPVLIQVKEM